jgi:hypothetical protein
MPKIIPAQIIDIGRFKALYFGSAPPRLEAAVVFDGHAISQKLVFQMMDISWRHGFGCGAPQFEDEGEMVFSIGTILPSSRSLPRYAAKLSKCLEEMADFSADFARQLDFSTLDISMFQGLDPVELDLSLIAAARDQQYGGNWETFQRAMKESGRDEEAQIVERCQAFEKINGKDIGLVGNKLLDTLAMVSDGEGAHQN